MINRSPIIADNLQPTTGHSAVRRRHTGSYSASFWGPGRSTPDGKASETPDVPSPHFSPGFTIFHAEGGQESLIYWTSTTNLTNLHNSIRVGGLMINLVTLMEISSTESMATAERIQLRAYREFLPSVCSSNSPHL